MTAPNYPTLLEAAAWSARTAAHKAALSRICLKVDLGDTLKSLQRAHDAVDWELFGTDGLATAEDAAQRQADLESERAASVKALLKLAAQARTDARSLGARFKGDPALKDDLARRAGDIAAAAEAYAGAVDDVVACAAKAVEKQRQALAAAPARAAAPDPKQAQLAAAVRARLIAALRAVRNPTPGQAPMKFIAGMAAAHARVAIGPNVGHSQKSQLLALLPQRDGIKWIKGECLWEEKALTFVCASVPSGAGRRLQRALLEQTRAKLRVRVRKPDGEAETCEGSDDPAALDATDADPAALKTRRVVDESMLRVRVDGLLRRIAGLPDGAARRGHAARVLKLKQAIDQLATLGDAAAVQALAVMGTKAAEQQAQLEAMAPAAAGGATRKPVRPGPRPRDLSDPAFARAVMAALTPEDRARIRTKADYEWAIARYDEIMAIRARLGPMPKNLRLTLPTIGTLTPQLLEERAQARAQTAADRKFLRTLFAEHGRDPAEADALDEEQVEKEMGEWRNSVRLSTSPIANDGLGDSKGAVNHFLDGAEHGLFKVAHDIGNIGLAAKYTYNAITTDAPPEDPQWFGAAGRMQGQNQSFGGLMWEVAGNIPIIGRAQLLYGATEMVRGAWNGDWNNVAYGLGNMAGAAMFGAAVARAPLAPGHFADTRLGRAYEGSRSFLFGERPPVARPRTPAAQRMPNDDGAHVPADLPTVDVRYAAKTPGGLQIEVAPHLAGTRELVQPDLARRMHAAAATVEGVLPPGRRIATPAGKPLSIVVDPAQPVPHIDRATGTVHMNPAIDAQAPFPKTGPGAEMARWAPKRGDASSTEVVMQHELGHAAMPEIATRLEGIANRKRTRAVMKQWGLSNSPKERLVDARLARESMLVDGLDELGADTIAVAAAKDLQAMPKSIAHGMAEALEAHAKNPDLPLPDEFPQKNPVEWMRRRDFSDGGTIPTVDEPVTPYDVFSGVRKHLGRHYGDALTGQDAPKVIGALMASNERFLQQLDADPALLDGDYVAANALFVSLFDAEAAKRGLVPKAR